jgi:hypothetical protein
MKTPAEERRAFLRTSCAIGVGTCVPRFALGQAAAPIRFGLTAPVGPQGDAKPSPVGNRRWDVEKSGVYENYRIDLDFADVDAVRIKADGVVLRNCEFTNGRRDAIEVYADDVMIESCRIRNFLAGTFAEQTDAHGVTGRGNRITIRNCEIACCSGDAWQMDPGREPWTDVVLEHCDIWTAPLAADGGGFKRGEQPGENGIDTKQAADHPRSKLTIRNCVFHGYRESGYIGMPAALNLKDNVEALVEQCVFYDNFVALRLRGPGKHGGAKVTVRDCYFYDCDTAVRMEDRMERLEIVRPRFGHGVKRRYRQVGGKPLEYKLEDEQDAPPLAMLLGKK